MGCIMYLCGWFLSACVGFMSPFQEALSLCGHFPVLVVTLSVLAGILCLCGCVFVLILDLKTA